MKHHVALQQLMDAVARGVALPGGARAHAADCVECGPALDRLLAAERAFEESDGLSERALEELERRVVGTPSVDAVAGESARADSQRRWRWDWLIGAGGASMVTAMGLLLFSPTPAPEPPAQDTFTARGVGTVDAPGGPALRLLCVTGSGVQGEARAGDPAFSRLGCSTRDVLGFVVTSPAQATDRYLYVVGVGADDEVRWYHPAPSSGGDGALPPAPFTNVPLDGIRLGTRHQPGTVRVHALFSPTPLAAGVVEQLARGTAEPPPGVTRHPLELQLQ